MRYYVSIGTHNIEVDLDGDRVTIAGEVVHAHIDPIPPGDLHVLRLGDAVHRLHARRPAGAGRGRYDVAIDGYRWGVEALDERARAIRDLAGSAERPTGPARLVAPMPGLIVRVNVNEGDRVRAGQGLVVMEAMKMENELKAATAGIVRHIAITPGSAVEKGALLLQMEATHEGK
jgi:acetyl/propionyl-CoA carboxylase alpha subunit